MTQQEFEKRLSWLISSVRSATIAACDASDFKSEYNKMLAEQVHEAMEKERNALIQDVRKELASLQAHKNQLATMKDLLIQLATS